MEISTDIINSDKKGANLRSDKKNSQARTAMLLGRKSTKGMYLQARLPTTLTFGLFCTQSIVPFE